MICHRCPDVEMEDDGEWFICPCCRCRTRGLERQQARHEARMAELGMTEDEYDAYCRSLIDHTPLTESQLAALQQRMQERSDLWVPACPHDTNPWLANSDREDS